MDLGLLLWFAVVGADDMGLFCGVQRYMALLQRRMLFCRGLWALLRCLSSMKCVAVSCSMLPYIAVCCRSLQRVVQCVAVCCRVLPCVAVCCRVLQCVAVCCSVLQRVVTCCSVLQRVAACCSMLQLVAVYMPRSCDEMCLLGVVVEED